MAENRAFEDENEITTEGAYAKTSFDEGYNDVTLEKAGQDVVDGGEYDTDDGDSGPDQKEAESMYLKHNEIANLQGITDAKDKTQATSATSMTIIHIAILKSILDVGREGMPYYSWSLALIITAISLQFLVGLISIYIAAVKSFVTEFHEDFATACFKRCCKCLLPCLPKRQIKPYAINVITTETSKLIDTQASDDAPESDDFDEERKTRECYERKVLDDYSIWKAQSYYKHMKAVSVVSNLYWIDKDLKMLKNKLKTLQRERDAGSGQSNSEDVINDLEKLIANKETKREELVETRREWVRCLRTGKVLEGHVKSITDFRVTEVVRLWQCVLTVMTFIVLALNAVITGFGLANMADSSPHHVNGTL